MKIVSQTRETAELLVLCLIVGFDSVHGRRAIIPLCGRVVVKGAELGGKGNVLLIVDVLVAKEYHLMLQDGGLDGIPLPGREWQAQIDAFDLGTDCRLQGADLDLVPGRTGGSLKFRSGHGLHLPRLSPSPPTRHGAAMPSLR
jgi:hypothetical protein